MAKELTNVKDLPCCPELIPDDHCDIMHFSRVLTFPANINAANRRRVNVEVILRFKFSRCTLGLTLGDPAYSTTLLPGEKVKLTTTDRRSRFSYDSESQLSYRSEQISEEQYYMTSFQKYMADASASQSGHAEQSSDSHWDFHGDASGSINPFSLSASASTNASGNHNSHSVADYLNQQRAHAQSAASQSVSSTRKAHSVSVGEVSSRTHIEGESQDQYEASSREFSNPNKCHAVTFMFYRLNKKQKIKFELETIERRVLDENAPIGGILEAATPKAPIALVPQDIPATVLAKRAQVAVTANAFVNQPAAVATYDISAISAINPAIGKKISIPEQESALPLTEAIRMQALKEVDTQLMAKGLIDQSGKPTEETKQSVDFEMEFALPTAGIIVKSCMDECGICEPLVQERMQLENDLLRKQIELLEKSQEYRCCPPPPQDNCDH